MTKREKKRKRNILGREKEKQKNNNLKRNWKESMKIRKRSGKRKNKIESEREKEKLNESKTGLLISKELKTKSQHMIARLSVNSQVKPKLMKEKNSDHENRRKMKFILRKNSSN